MFKSNPFKNIRRPLISLTGGIASGKTLVAREFARLGAVIIDSDKISRKVCGRGTPALRRITACFGKGILNSGGTLNRKRLGHIVLSSVNKRKALESIVHPAIISEIVKKLNFVNQNKIAIVDAPLLFESGLARYMDKVIVVWVPQKIQTERLMKRNKLTNKEAALWISSQMPIVVKRKNADILVDNTGTVGATKKKIKKIWEVLTKKS